MPVTWNTSTQFCSQELTSCVISGQLISGISCGYHVLDVEHRYQQLGRRWWSGGCTYCEAHTAKLFAAVKSWKQCWMRVLILWCTYYKVIFRNHWKECCTPCLSDWRKSPSHHAADLLLCLFMRRILRQGPVESFRRRVSKLFPLLILSHVCLCKLVLHSCVRVCTHAKWPLTWLPCPGSINFL